MKYLIALSFLFLNSCIHKAVESVIPSKGYKAEEVQKVKSVAIVAFDVMQFQPTGVAGKFVGSVSTAQMVTNTVPTESPLALETYSYLAGKIKQNRNWRVLSAQEVAQNPVYKKLYEAKKKIGAKAAIASNHFQKPLVVGGILRPINPEYLFSHEEIAELSKALKVDSLILAQLSYSTRQNDYTGLGIANIYLTSYLSFYMLNAKNGNKVWFDKSFQGPISNQSLGKVSGLEDATKIESLSRPLAEKTVDGFLTTKQ
ncbi:MAG: hypothetical protein AB7H97_22755 [Pseudobdellovibrionaceae bacterium]